MLQKVPEVLILDVFRRQQGSACLKIHISCTKQEIAHMYVQETKVTRKGRPADIIRASGKIANISKGQKVKRNGGGTFWRLLTCHLQSCPLPTSLVACFFFSWAAASYGDGVSPCTSAHTHCQTPFRDVLATCVYPTVTCLHPI